MSHELTPSATAALAQAEPGTVVRPLSKLAFLIQADLVQGRGAAERAAMPYYLAAGEKLIEAKSQLDHGEFKPWVQRHFGISHKQATIYMRLAADTAERSAKKLPAGNFSSLNDFVGQTVNQKSARTLSVELEQQDEEVNELVERIDDAALTRDEQHRAHEREAQRELAVRLIDRGYKALARTLHPDKGGSREAMTRLNVVRDLLLEQCARGTSR